MPDGREQENLYDGEGVRAGIKENGKESTFLYYNGEILTECSGSMASSVPVRRYQRGIFLSRVEDMDTGKNYAYNQDEQGSTVYITGNNGTVENSYVYDAFGNVLEGKESIENRIQYTGQQYDQETGQYYLRARFYNPVIGRFTQEDTYRGDGLNLYAYCGNNPVMYYDPSGHDGMAYSDDPSTGSGQSRVEQVDEEVDNGGVNFGSNDKIKLDYITSSGLELEATQGKTTTILGTYSSDTKAILDELGNIKSLDFGPKDGGFNLLNTPDELYVSPDQFWNEYNKPWLDNVISRDDIIKIATEPTWDNLTRVNVITGKTELTGFGREYTYLMQHGYKYDPITKTMNRQG